jgi:malonyl-CoA O-methyltransferase
LAMQRPELMQSSEIAFSATVQRCFGHNAGSYEQGARLQAGVAHRLGRLCRPLAATLPPGPRADLGAGSGLLARAIEQAIGGSPLLRLDACAPLLAQSAAASGIAPERLQWDLNNGLPEQLQGAALLASSFALQWLEHPDQALEQWCQSLRPGGSLALAVPCSGSFQLWHQAAEHAAVPCTALELPCADSLLQRAAPWLVLQHQQRLRFSRPNRGALTFLRQIKAIGAQASRGPRLSPGELRRLIEHWPGAETPILWEVLLLVGCRR